MKKQFGIILAFVLCSALSVGVAPKASAAGANFSIRTQTEWATVAPGGSLTLADGDTLSIAMGAGSPSTATTISIAKNANVTINGGGVMRTGVCITESTDDTAPHTVTINNLHITAPAVCNGGYATYTQYTGTINLVNSNTFVGAANSMVLIANSFANGLSLNITSSTGGALTVTSNSPNKIASYSFASNIQGNANVTVNASGTLAMYPGNAINIDGGASLTVNSPNNMAIQGGSGPGILVVTNNGTLTVSGGRAGVPALSSNNGTPTIRMGAGAVTSITSAISETHSFAMIPANGYMWQVSGGASVVAPGTVVSSPASIVFPGSTTGVVTLVRNATGTTINSVTITGNPRVGGTLSVATDGVTPSGATLSYQWNIDGAPVSGATGSNYTPQPTDVGKSLTVTVTVNYADASGTWTPSTVTSPGVQVQPGDLSIPKPVISGTPQVGSVLTAKPGGLIPAGSVLSYQWFSGYDAVGSDSSTYTPTTSDVGKAISVAVSWSVPGYYPVSQISDPTVAVVVKPDVPVYVPMYRIFSPYTGEHFYTSSAKEASVNVSSGAWTYEGVGWYAPTSGVQVYRLAAIPGSGAAGHLFTTSVKERDAALASLNPAGQPYWKCETGAGMPACVGWYSGGTIPVYRAFNPMPGPGQGQHNYTTDTNEQRVITGTGPLGGWKDEGVAWYAMQAANPAIPLPV